MRSAAIAGASVEKTSAADGVVSDAVESDVSDVVENDRSTAGAGANEGLIDASFLTTVPRAALGRLDAAARRTVARLLPVVCSTTRATAGFAVDRLAARAGACARRVTERVAVAPRLGERAAAASRGESTHPTRRSARRVRQPTGCIMRSDRKAWERLSVGGIIGSRSRMSTGDLAANVKGPPCGGPLYS